MRCTIDDCPNEAVALGMCMKHYMRMRRTGDPTAAREARRTLTDTALREEIAALQQENTALRRHLAEARRRASRPARKQSEATSLRKQVRELKKRLQRVVEGPKGALVVSAADRRTIRAALHPDNFTTRAQKRRADKASQIFKRSDHDRGRA